MAIGPGNRCWMSRAKARSLSVGSSQRCTGIKTERLYRRIVIVRVTTCLENLEMSGNLKLVTEMSGMLLTVRELSGKKSCHGKVSQNCSLLDEYLRSYGYSVVLRCRRSLWWPIQRTVDSGETCHGVVTWQCSSRRWFFHQQRIVNWQYAWRNCSCTESGVRCHSESRNGHKECRHYT